MIKFTKTLLLGMMVAICAVGSGMATEVSTDPAVRPPTPAYDWSGFYNQTGGAGSLWGERWGSQQQWNNLVLGVEAAYSDPFNRSYALALSPAPDCIIAGSRCDSRGAGSLMVGPRLGWASDRLLLFGTGGYTLSRPDMPAGIGLTGVPARETGTWFAGAGVEYALSTSSAFDVILGAEYRRIGAVSRRDFDPSGLLNINPRDTRSDVDLARARLSIKLNSWGPLVDGK